MRVFEGLHAFERFAFYLSHAVPVQTAAGLTAALREIGALVAAHARSKVGVYQVRAGPYAGWDPLALSTIERKQRLGQLGRRSADDPLYATGAFLADIHYEIHLPTWSVAIGTSKEYIVYTELGTRRMPPRPIFGPAVLERQREITAAAIRATAFGLTGEAFSFSTLVPWRGG